MNKVLNEGAEIGEAHQIEIGRLGVDEARGKVLNVGDSVGESKSLGEHQALNENGYLMPR